MLIDNLLNYKIILASKSPRRQQLLSELGLSFEVVIMNWTEEYPSSLKGAEIALFVANSKAETFKSGIKENEIIITADTIVWCNNKVLGKPLDETDAYEILKEISGNTHEVITGICLLSSKKHASFYSTTKVTFNEMTDKEILYYITNYHPYDKAGGYGIQEWIGLAACSNIEGSYFNVMGLPVHQVYRELQSFIDAE